MRVLSLASLVWFCALKALAAAPPVLDAAAYGRLPAMEMVSLSPSGNRMAYVTVTGDERRVVVADADGKPLMAAPIAKNKIRDIKWAGEDHIIIFGSQTTQSMLLGDNEFGYALTINLTTQKVVTIFSGRADIFHAIFGYYGSVPQNGHWYGLFGGVTLSKSLGFDATFYNNGFADLYRVDLDSGVATMAASGWQQPRHWAIGGDGQIVAHSEYDDAGGNWSLWSEANTSKPLIKIRTPLSEVSLSGLGRTPGTVIVQNGLVEEWSLDTGAHAPLPIGGVVSQLVHDPVSHYLVGAVVAGDRPEQRFFEPKLNARFQALRKAVGESARLLSWSSDYQHAIIFTDGDGDAGTYWVVNGKAIKAFAYAYPDVPDANVGPSQVISYHAADGTPLDGILTLPPGREAKALPLVVLPHGGPQARDYLGFDWWAQAFAGRGYAVFQPNFRGSDDYGTAFRDAGFGQWGRKMQTDISDGVAELTRQGLIDGKRACIVGASYGGYAALAGVTVQQGLYRCAVSVAGVSDLNYMLNWESTHASDSSMRYWRRFMGVTSEADPSLRALSPAKLAARADAPILLIHGSDDTVVPMGQSKAMESALRNAGKPVEFVTLKSEDHWLSQTQTRQDMLKAAMDFVQKYNPAQGATQ